MKRIKSLIMAIILVMACFTATVFTACSKESSDIKYRLYRYDNTNVGQNFYGFKLTKDMVQLTLEKDGELVLKIDKGFIVGYSSLVGEYLTFEGTWEEEGDTITAYIPGFEDVSDGQTTIVAIKNGNRLLLYFDAEMEKPVVLEK